MRERKAGERNRDRKKGWMRSKNEIAKWGQKERIAYTYRVAQILNLNNNERKEYIFPLEREPIRKERYR